MARIQKKLAAGDKKKRNEYGQSSGQGEAPNKSRSVVKKTVKSEQLLREVKPEDMGFFAKSGIFLREVTTELKKVTWPNKKQTTGTTLVVLVFVFVAAAFLGLFDYGLSKLVQVILT